MDLIVLASIIWTIEMFRSKGWNVFLLSRSIHYHCDLFILDLICSGSSSCPVLLPELNPISYNTNER